jgi:hypothetical protein
MGGGVSAALDTVHDMRARMAVILRAFLIGSPFVRILQTETLLDYYTSPLIAVYEQYP